MLRLSQSRTFVELPLSMGSILIDVMEEDLCQTLARVRLAPMRNFNSAIDEHISREQSNGNCIPRMFHPDRPWQVGCVSQTECCADFTCRAVYVSLQAIVMLVKPQVRIRWIQSEANLTLNYRLNGFQ